MGHLLCVVGRKHQWNIEITVTLYNKSYHLYLACRSAQSWGQSYCCKRCQNRHEALPSWDVKISELFYITHETANLDAIVGQHASRCKKGITVHTGRHFKNTYELVNLRARKFSILNKNHIFQCMGKISCVQLERYPDSKVHGASMGPIWGRQDPGGPHVGPMYFAIWVPFEIPHRISYSYIERNIDGLMQERHNPIANTLELVFLALTHRYSLLRNTYLKAPRFTSL